MYNLDTPLEEDRVALRDLLLTRISEDKKDVIRTIVGLHPRRIRTYDERCDRLESLRTAPSFIDAKKALEDLYYSQTRIIKDMKELVRSNPSIISCPYCQIDSDLPILDHFLAIDNHPEFALHNANLVPSCFTCNTVYKGTNFLNANRERLFFNPYYDQLGTGRFLFCNMNIDSHVNLAFSVGGNRNTEYLNDLMPRHFESMGLNSRYQKVSQQYVKPIIVRLKRIYRTRGCNQVARTLEIEYQNNLEDFGHNYWLTAFLREAKDNIDFCDRGFELPFRLAK